MKGPLFLPFFQPNKLIKQYNPIFILYFIKVQSAPCAAFDRNFLQVAHQRIVGVFILL